MDIIGKMDAGRPVRGRLIWASVVIVSICCGSFFFLLAKSNLSVNPNYEDTGSYLEAALIIRESGGAAHFVQNCLNGTYRIAEQHPLYLLALSPFASRDLSFFPKAKLVSIFFGLLVITLLFFITYKYFGPVYASTAALLLALNTSFISRATHVTVETLLIGLVLAAWLFLYLGANNPRWWLAAGIVSGLAFATKGTGLFLLGVFVLGSFILHGKAIFRNKWFWAFIGVFFLVNLPLLARNLIVYNRLLYEGINSHIFWLDNWNQLSSPQYRLVVDWAEHTYSWEGLPTFFTFLQNHSLADIVKRFLSGFFNELILCAKMTYLHGIPFNSVSSVGMVLIGLLAVVLDRDRHRKVYTIVLTLSFIAAFAWLYPVVSKDRYITPLIPLMIFYFVAGLRRIAQWIGAALHIEPEKWPCRQAILAGLVVCLIAGQVYVIYRYRNQSLVHPPLALAADQQEFLDWIRQNLDRRHTLVLAPTSRYWGYMWYAHYKGKLAGNPGSSPLFADEPIERITQFLRETPVSHIAIHSENYRQPKAFLDYFQLGSDKVLRCREVPSRWNPCYHYDGQEKQFFIFSIDNF